MSNFIDPYILNLYHCGIIKKEDNEMAYINASSNDYRIYFERKSTTFFNDNFSYICKFIIKDILGRDVLDIICSEIDIYNLLDCLYQFAEFGQRDVVIPLNSSNQFNKYIFKFEKDNLNNNVFIISEYNSISELFLERIRMTFDDDSFSSFCTMIYFTFLIDLDSEWKLY